VSEHDAEHHVRQRSPAELRAAALEAELVEAGIISTDAIDAEVGPRQGARMVARAWVDPDYRQRLLDDATAAAEELGIAGMEGQHLVAVANTGPAADGAAVHNVIVCTLCSCYPWPVLGVPPVWYKSPPYRSRVVREPRAVLAEFGLQLDEGTEVRVWDSSAEVRYLVLPRRPEGTDDLDEAELAALVTRDGMIGVAAT
jgi:nitrile hydratase